MSRSFSLRVGAETGSALHIRDSPVHYECGLGTCSWVRGWPFTTLLMVKPDIHEKHLYKRLKRLGSLLLLVGSAKDAEYHIGLSTPTIYLGNMALVFSSRILRCRYGSVQRTRSCWCLDNYSHYSRLDTSTPLMKSKRRTKKNGQSHRHLATSFFYPRYRNIFATYVMLHENR